MLLDEEPNPCNQYPMHEECGECYNMHIGLRTILEMIVGIGYWWIISPPI